MSTSPTLARNRRRALIIRRHRLLLEEEVRQLKIGVLEDEVLVDRDEDVGR